jgi:hypothetical protein
MSDLISDLEGSAGMRRPKANLVRIAGLNPFVQSFTAAPDGGNDWAIEECDRRPRSLEYPR